LLDSQREVNRLVYPCINVHLRFSAADSNLESNFTTKAAAASKSGEIAGCPGSRQAFANEPGGVPGSAKRAFFRVPRDRFYKTTRNDSGKWEKRAGKWG